MDRVSYTMEDLYYNIYFKDEEPLKLNAELDDIKFGIYRRGVTSEQIREALKRKIWITNSPIGWSDELENILKEYYGI